MVGGDHKSIKQFEDLFNTVTLDSESVALNNSHRTDTSRDDHTQYSRTDGTRSFTGPVGGVTPVADSDLATKKFVEDIDYPQYSLIDGTRDFTGVVKGVDPVDDKDLATKIYVDDEAHPIGNLLGSGVLSGGYITTVFGGTTYDIAAGTGYIVDNYTDSTEPVITKVSWSAKTGLTPTGLGTLDTQFITIDTNGDLVEQDVLPTEIEMRDVIYLGKLLMLRTGTTVFGLTFPRMSFAIKSQLDDLIAAIGIVTNEGNIFSSNGDNLSLNRSAGITHRVGANYPNQSAGNMNGYKNPSTLPNVADTVVVFARNYRSATPGVFINEAMQTELNPTQYDDGSGTLATVPTGKFTVQRVYFFTAGTTFVTYGQAVYDTFNQALDGSMVEDPTVEEQFSVDAALRAQIVVQAEATSLQNQMNTNITATSKFGDLRSPSGRLTIDFKSVGLSTQAADTYYTFGFYDGASSDSNLTQASSTQTFGTANNPYGAHAFIVAAAAGTASGGTGPVEIEVSGASIDPITGIRTAVDTEILVADITTMSTDEYIQTTKNWVGQITFTLKNASGSSQTTFAADFNYGFADYEDWGLRDFDVTDFEMIGLAGKNDSGFDVELLHHRTTGWTYAATGFIPGDGKICQLTTDYGPDSDLKIRENFSYKRGALDTAVAGSSGEGVIVRVTTGAVSSVDNAQIHIGSLLI